MGLKEAGEVTDDDAALIQVLLFSAGEEAAVFIWDLLSRSLMHVLRHPAGSGTIRFLLPLIKTAGLLLAGGDEDVIRVWEPDDNYCQTTIPAQHTGHVKGMALGYYTQKIFFCGDNALYRYDVWKGEAVAAEITGPTIKFSSLALSFDEKLLYTASFRNSMLYVWRAATFELLAMVEEYQLHPQATSIALTYDGAYLLLVTPSRPTVAQYLVRPQAWSWRNTSRFERALRWRYWQLLCCQHVLVQEAYDGGHDGVEATTTTLARDPKIFVQPMCLPLPAESLPIITRWCAQMLTSRL